LHCKADERAAVSNLDRALAEISAIRGQIARASEFRGYGPATFALTGILALAAAAAQALWLPAPDRHVLVWLALWVSVAAASAAIIGWEMVTRSRRIHSDLADEMIRAAVEQFVPSGLAGGFVTLILLRYAPQDLPALPGLWQIIFALGLFASRRFLPRRLAVVGLWYLACGLYALTLAGGPDAYGPWVMGAAFGVGQLGLAALLHYSLGGADDRA
jgi:hypothetical protein